MNAHKITKLYAVLVEEPGGYYFVPEGLLAVDNLGQFLLMCTDARHNFLRTAVQKYRFSDLHAGVKHREHTVRLDDLTGRLAKYGDDFSHLQDMLKELLAESPRHYHFLSRYLSGPAHHNPFVSAKSQP